MLTIYELLKHIALSRKAICVSYDYIIKYANYNKYAWFYN